MTKYITRQLFKNVFFDAFKVVDKLIYRNEFINHGKSGEQYAYRALWYYFKDQLFRNVRLRDQSGHWIEIDLIGVGRKGLYVFESKNYSGKIEGNGENKYWHQYIKKRKSTFYSPILQNRRHIDVLKYTFTKFTDLPCFSVILFGDRCQLNLKNVKDVLIIKMDKKENNELDVNLKKLIEAQKDVLSTEEVAKICNVLAKFGRSNKIKWVL